MNTNTILIADDQEISRLIIAQLFESEYRVLQAANGLEALNILRKEHESISVVVLDIVMPVMGGYELLAVMRDDDNLKNIPVIIITSGDSAEDEVKALDAGATDYIRKPIDPRIVIRRVQNLIQQRDLEAARLENARLLERTAADAQIRYRAYHDHLTGIYNYTAFCDMTAKKLENEPHKEHFIVSLNIERFKLINSLYGNAIGDLVLMRIANTLREQISETGTYCRIQGDQFAFCCSAESLDIPKLKTFLNTKFNIENEIISIKLRAGIYQIEHNSLSVEQMCDRANLAVQSIKGKYGQDIAYYDKSMLESLLIEQEIINEMAPALKNQEFKIYLQPQYNHITSEIVGAEALVRWEHPKKGIIPPKDFIPVFERNGFVATLDEYIWEQACKLLASWRDEGRPLLPVSVNISRVDIYNPRLTEIFSELIKKYGLPASLLRLEITESAYMENPQELIDAVTKLQGLGFLVEMDDFGSGYSSLNSLKDVPVDILKLDMNFLSGDNNNDRGGRILSSVVRMAKYLSLPVIAEGVETSAQAGYLKEIGCNLVQGYLYSPPIPVSDFNTLVSESIVCPTLPKNDFAEILEKNYFWNTNDQTNLLFSSFVGPAAIIEYDGKNLEALRVNDKYYKELNISRKHYEDIRQHIGDWLYEGDEQVYQDALHMSIELQDEIQCELRWHNPYDPGHLIWLRIRLRLIAGDGGIYVFFCAIQNNSRLMRTLDRLEQTNAQMETIIRHVNEGICIFAVSGQSHLVYSNDVFFKILGYTREQFSDEITDTYSIILPEDRAVVIESVRKCAESQESYPAVYRAVRRDGSICKLRAESSKIKGKDSSINYVLSIITDITTKEQKGKI